jgi:excisionase family DNA binding protein
MPDKLAYSVREAAQALGISEWSVRRAIEAGRLPAVRFGSRIVIPRFALERTLMELASRETGALQTQSSTPPASQGPAK